MVTHAAMFLSFLNPYISNSHALCCLVLGEANLWAGDLVTMYKKYAESENWKAQMTEESIGDEGGYKSCVIEV